jgi:hypothetical protein
MASGVHSLGLKQPECEIHHSPPSSAKVTNGKGYTSPPRICIHGVGRDNCDIIDYVREGNMHVPVLAKVLILICDLLMT